jgi:hypothetical protein
VIAKSNPTFLGMFPPPIVNHKAKMIMNQIYVDHEVYEWRVLTPISRHNFPPIFEEET